MMAQWTRLREQLDGLRKWEQRKRRERLVLEAFVYALLLALASMLVVIGVGATGPVAIQPEAASGLGLIGIAAGSILAFFAFLRFEDMVNMVEETREPARTVPRAIFAALAASS